MTDPVDSLAESDAARGERLDEDRARAQVYGLIAALLVGPPEEPLLQMLREIEAPAGEPDGEMAAAWGLIKQAAERADPSGLRDEYQDLFIGIGRGELVPYGSWYVTGFLMEKPLAELRTDLKRLGFEVREGVQRGHPGRTPGGALRNDEFDRIEPGDWFRRTAGVF